MFLLVIGPRAVGSARPRIEMAQPPRYVGRVASGTAAADRLGESANYPAGNFRWALALCRALLGFWVRLGSGTLR